MRTKPVSLAIDANQPIADLIVRYPQLLSPLMVMGIKPALGNSTLNDHCQGRSIGVELCTDLLELLVNPDYQPKAQVRYNLLPLTGYYCKLQQGLRPWLNVLKHHLQHFTESADSQPVITLCTNFTKNLEDHIAEQAEFVPNVLNRLYELFYSPVFTAEDEHILTDAQTIISKGQGNLFADELDDIVSLLLRHTKVSDNETAYCAAIYQLNQLRASINYIRQIRTKLLHPMVSDMVRTIRRRCTATTKNEQP